VFGTTLEAALLSLETVIEVSYLFPLMSIAQQWFRFAHHSGVVIDGTQLPATCNSVFSVDTTTGTSVFTDLTFENFNSPNPFAVWNDPLGDILISG